MTNSLETYGLQPARVFCPWDSSGKNTGVGCHAFLQGIFPTQGSNPHLLHLLHWQAGSLPPTPAGKRPLIQHISPKKTNSGLGKWGTNKDDASRDLNSACTLELILWEWLLFESSHHVKIPSQPCGRRGILVYQPSHQGSGHEVWIPLEHGTRSFP